MSDYEFIDGYACASIMRIQAAANQKYSNPQTVTVSIGHFQAASKVTGTDNPPEYIYNLYCSYWSSANGGGLQKISDNLFQYWFRQY